MNFEKILYKTKFHKIMKEKGFTFWDFDPVNLRIRYAYKKGKRKKFKNFKISKDFYNHFCYVSMMYLKDNWRVELPEFIEKDLITYLDDILLKKIK